MTRALLLCAGYGTRLGDLSEVFPKPLLPVCDIAIARYGIALLVGHGIRDIAINLHYRGEQLRDELGAGEDLGARIQYAEEPEILGTGGGIKNALGLLDPDDTDEPFLVLNGKLIFDLDIAALLRAHAADPEALGTLVVRRAEGGDAFSAVDVGRDAAGHPRVRDIFAGGQHMFCGVHVTRASVMRRLPEGASCSIRQGYLPWLRAGGQVAAYEVNDSYFAEHSTPARYLSSNLALLRRALAAKRDGPPALAHPPAQLMGIDISARVDPTAIIRHPVRIGARAHVGADAVVGPEVVIGNRAHVEPQARIERSVVWRGARAHGHVRDSIVTARGTVRV
jgi:mannose-1-phosphate guanylyltransferase